MINNSDVKVLILRTAGTNCDLELARAFELAGASATRLHINQLLADASAFNRHQILAIPGGFSYGDDIASGKILANQLIHHLKQPLQQWVADGKLIIGICNGFQVLVKSGLLPGPMPQLSADDWHPATLTHNAHNRFEDRWVHLRAESPLCKWLTPGQRLHLPIAHGEGRFVTRDASVLNALKANHQIALRYVDSQGNTATNFPDNPNGSTEAIAGICDITGRVFGLMPHPERFADLLQGPAWTRRSGSTQADGLEIFTNAVGCVRQKMAVAV